MIVEPGLAARLAFLVRVSRRESDYLRQTDGRLFCPVLSLEQVSQLAAQPDLSERVEAFVGRFGRLQDTLGDKLLPALLALAGERPGAAIDNLDRAERLGWITSVDDWMSIRLLRNRMIHEYIEDPVVLADALNTGHLQVAVLLAACDRMVGEADRRLEKPVR